jgi:hypothetical protein
MPYPSWATGDGPGDAILAEKQEHGLPPPPHDGRDPSMKLGQTRARVDKINGECTAEAGQLCVDISYAAPLVHGTVNVFSRHHIYILPTMKDSYHV